MSAPCDCCLRRLETNVREAISLLDAIAVGRMLKRPGTGEEGEAQHVAAEALLEVARKRLADGLSVQAFRL